MAKSFDPKSFVELEVEDWEAVSRGLLSSESVAYLSIVGRSVSSLPVELRPTATKSTGWRSVLGLSNTNRVTLPVGPSVVDGLVSLLMEPRTRGRAVGLYDEGMVCLASAYDWAVGCCPVTVFGPLRAGALTLDRAGVARAYQEGDADV
jgi:hypothetical protein